MNKARGFLLAVAVAAMAFTVSCSSNNSLEGITLSSNSYETTQSSSSEEATQSSSSEETAQSSSSEEAARSSSSEETAQSSSSEEAARSSSSETSSVSLCAGQEYDPDIFRCEFGELVGKCAGGDFYPAYQICDGGVIKNKNEPSSSSVAPSSSSSAPSSSSSTPPSSSSITPSSSSEYCAGFVYGTEREHYGKMKKQFCDERDGKRYVYVEIGTQTWMAENLNYNVSDSKCYGEDAQVAIDYDEYENHIVTTAKMLTDEEVQTNCAKYGRLYYLSTAMKICPDGWHLPSNAEWIVLRDYTKPEPGKKLKAVNGWNDFQETSGNGTDDYGFSALPGGRGDFYSTSLYKGAGRDGIWWNATSSMSDDYWDRISHSVEYDSESFKSTSSVIPKNTLYSVRCIHN